MAKPEQYIIRWHRETREEGESLQLGQIVKRCEEIAEKDKDAFFVGRETIRGRLRCGIRTWEGLTSPVASRRARVANHAWRKGSPEGVRNRPRTHPDDSVYEPEDYIGPDEALDAILGR